MSTTCTSLRCATSQVCAMTGEPAQMPAPRTMTFAALDKLPPRRVAAVETKQHCDLLGIPVFEGADLPRLLVELDKVTANDITELIDRLGFKGSLGQGMLLDLRMMGVKEAYPHYVMLVGAGKMHARLSRCQPQLAETEQLSLCAIFAAFLEATRKLEVERLIVAFDDLPAAHVDLTGAAATLHCRCLVETLCDISRLEEVYVLCRNDQLSAVESGLHVSGKLCLSCSRPAVH